VTELLRIKCERAFAELCKRCNVPPDAASFARIVRAAQDVFAEEATKKPRKKRRGKK
jgi:hypothetical protein